VIRVFGSIARFFSHCAVARCALPPETPGVSTIRSAVITVAAGKSLRSSMGRGFARRSGGKNRIAKNR
jgi:hypothetical protein